MIKTLKLTTAALCCVAAAGNAYTDNASTFGPTQNTAVTVGNSYAGIALTATDANNGSNGFGSYTAPVNLLDYNSGTGVWDVPVTFNIHTDQPAGFGPGGADGFGSTITILAGEASASTNVSLRVRKPNDNEVFGFSTTPPAENSPGWYSVLSDVYELTGIAATGPAVGGKTPTDVFALQISYLDNNLANTNTTPEAYMEDYIYQHGNVKSWTETDIANAGELQIAFFDTSAGTYSEDDLGNFGVGSTVIENYQGSWASFAAANSVTDANLGDFLGSWGVDTTNNNVWGIFDHNTSFVVVPEPQSLAIFGIGALMLARRARRSRH